VPLVTDTQTPPVQILGPVTETHLRLLTTPAIQFLTRLARMFEPRRGQLLRLRRERQWEFDDGRLPDFLPETDEIRRSDWCVAPPPADLTDRRVEITGPTDRKTMIDGLNSGANAFLADFEDCTSPTWRNILDGQVNLRDAVQGNIRHTGPAGERYSLDECPAVLTVRPRGWHLEEKHFLVDGEPIAAALFDFGVFLFHNARPLIESGTGPYFYLPKLEGRLEARLWNDVFLAAQNLLGISRGTIRATVSIETIPAAFEMDEILWELRDHSAGLGFGRSDYIFSLIKKFQFNPGFTMPEYRRLTMEREFLQACATRLIQTCHRRGAHAMGGMAAGIPVNGDAAASEAALQRIRQDKLRDVWSGHDGTRVAHPGLVPLAQNVFDTYMPSPNQVRRRIHGTVTAEDLLRVPRGEITREGLRWNVDVGLRYLAAWLRGNGCVPIHNQMEGAATAEICRAQVWQWAKHGAPLGDGGRVTPELVRNTILERAAVLDASASGPEPGTACRLFEELATAPLCAEFLTVRAYEHLD